jgi:hypothetical protein
MFKDLKTKKVVIIIAIVVVVLLVIFLLRKKKPLESSFEEPSNETNEVAEGMNENEPEVEGLPGFFQLQYKISTQGKKYVFPMILEKITPGPIELPNRRSLLNKDAKYKFKDIMPGDKIKAVSVQNLTYTVDHNAFNDNFLVTDNDYLIAYSQAKEHFKIAE